MSDHIQMRGGEDDGGMTRRRDGCQARDPTSRWHLTLINAKPLHIFYDIEWDTSHETGPRCQFAVVFVATEPGFSLNMMSSDFCAQTQAEQKHSSNTENWT